MARRRTNDLEFLAVVVASFAMNVVVLPITLRTGISQELGSAFNIAWIKEFVALTWKEMLLGGLALMAMQFAAMIVGLMLFCIGLYPAIVVVFYSAIHYQWQLYEIFLDRGGTPVPLKQAPYVAAVPPKQF